MIPSQVSWRATFGPFTLTPSQRLLERDGMPVRLGGRALDLLIALVERAGETVGKQALLARVWPDVVVEEGSLRFHMVAVRKALGDGEDGRRYIVSSPNKGYTFVTKVVRHESVPSVHQAGPPVGTALPSPVGMVVGREEDIASIVRSVSRNRLVSIIGSGGIGKTTVALAAAHALVKVFADQIYFVDLTSASTAENVPATVARALGVQNGFDNLDGMAAHLCEHPALLVLDSCEHMIHGAAELVESLASKCPRVFFLVTSREPLRAHGEFVFRLRPLAYPQDGQGDTAAAALSFPAVKLFVDRAAASGGYVLSDEDAPLASRLCCELDGIALAIELAAGRVQAFGLAAILSHFDAGERLAWRGRRTATPRQQTLGATLEWSYQLLSQEEMRLFRSLSVFATSFTLEAALQVCCTDEDKQPTREWLAGLVDKSLLNVDSSGTTLRYAMFDATRTFGKHKLAATGEHAALLQRFSSYFYALAVDYEDRMSIRSLGLELPNLRVAIEWFFGPGADPVAAVKFATAFCPILLQLSQVRECSRWAKMALTILPDALRGSRYEAWLQLHSARGEYFGPASVPPNDASLAFRRGIEVAETLRDRRTVLHMLNGYAVSLHRGGRFAEALSVARRAEAVVGELGDHESRTLVESLVGAALHLTGHIAQATPYLEWSAASSTPTSLSTESSLGFDLRTRSLSGLARSLWLKGSYSQGLALAQATIAEAQQSGHGVTQCLALIWAGAVHGWHGNLEAMEQTVESLEAAASRHSIPPYLSIASARRGQIAVLRGRPAEGVERLRIALKELHAFGYEMVTSAMLTVLAEGLSRMSLHSASLETCDQAEKVIRAGGDHLRMPELLTVRGRCLDAAARHEEAARSYEAAIEVARAQGSQFGRVRAAALHAQQLARRGRTDQARSLLREHVGTLDDDIPSELAIARSILA